MRSAAWALAAVLGLASATAVGLMVADERREDDPPVPVPRELVEEIAGEVVGAARSRGYSTTRTLRVELDRSAGPRATDARPIYFTPEPDRCVAFVMAVHGDFVHAGHELLPAEREPFAGLCGNSRSRMNRRRRERQRRMSPHVRVAARCYGRDAPQRLRLAVRALDPSSDTRRRGGIRVTQLAGAEPLEADGSEASIEVPPADFEVRKGPRSVSRPAALRAGAGTLGGWAVLAGLVVVARRKRVKTRRWRRKAGTD